jgi:hypothetical protein
VATSFSPQVFDIVLLHVACGMARASYPKQCFEGTHVTSGTPACLARVDDYLKQETRDEDFTYPLQKTDIP